MLKTKDYNVSRFKSYYNCCFRLGFKPQVNGIKVLGEVWICLSLDEKVDSSKDYTHIAFTISEENFEKMKNILKRNN